MKINMSATRRKITSQIILEIYWKIYIIIFFSPWSFYSYSFLVKMTLSFSVSAEVLKPCFSRFCKYNHSNIKFYSYQKFILIKTMKLKTINYPQNSTKVRAGASHISFNIFMILASLLRVHATNLFLFIYGHMYTFSHTYTLRIGKG